ncbi:MULTISPECIES: MFS transporter [Micromonospora]|uniref:MFS transporter n=1 Tax=Micromonospora TaxID=1873 RepID=UPI0006AFB811|nr:MFS transporter [Micromonospora sp. NRRL B-16802]KOX03156.1 MFS transporter [Micromonospora sp. NRRL B-16802]
MHDATLTAVGQRAGRRQWLGLAALALPTLLVAIDNGVLILALPKLSADLAVSGTQQLWITDVYGFMLAGWLITMGTLGDRVGRRLLLLVGAVAFTAASVLAAYSTSAEMLILARAAMGIAGATLMPSTLALIMNMFADAKQRGFAIATWATCQFVGSALGPVVGGLLLEHFWWGSVFLLGVPVMLILLLVGPVLLPEYRSPGAGRLDLVSVALSLAAILPIIYGMKELAVHSGAEPLVPTTAIVVGLIFAVVFAQRQRRLESPLLDLSLFQNRSFTVLLSAMLFTGAAMAGLGLLSSQYVQSVAGLTPGESGLSLAPMGISIAVGTMLAPVLVRRIKQGTVISVGLAMSTLGFVLMTLVDATGGLVVVVLGIVLIFLGDGPLVALGTGLIMGSVPPERAGSAAAMSETSLNLGGTLGMAVLGTVGAAIYRGQMSDAVPAGLSADESAVARETIAGATAVADGLPAGPAAQLLDAAREAFTTGLNVAAAIGVAIFVVCTILIAVTMRQRDKETVASEPTPAEEPATA